MIISFQLNISIDNLDNFSILMISHIFMAIGASELMLMCNSEFVTGLFSLFPEWKVELKTILGSSKLDGSQIQSSTKLCHDKSGIFCIVGCKLKSNSKWPANVKFSSLLANFYN